MAYKITDPDLCSCRARGELQVQYKIDEWVKPPYGPSLVFKRLEDAVNFSMSTCYAPEFDYIFRCRTKELKPVELLVDALYLDSVIKLWLNLLKHKCVPESLKGLLFDAPKGTYSATKVMLTKLIRKY